MAGRHRASKSRQKAGYVVAACAAISASALVANVAHADPDWSAIIGCESGGNPTAQNPSSTASGLFQFLNTSWIAYGGGKYASRAKDATPAQQTEIANRAYALSGLSPWAASRGCWAGKVGIVSKAVIPAKPRRAAGPAPAGNTTTVTVQLGDTLSTLAAAHGTTWQQLQTLNGIQDADLIYSGQALRLP